MNIPMQFPWLMELLAVGTNLSYCICFGYRKLTHRMTRQRGLLYAKKRGLFKRPIPLCFIPSRSANLKFELEGISDNPILVSVVRALSQDGTRPDLQLRESMVM